MPCTPRPWPTPAPTCGFTTSEVPFQKARGLCVKEFDLWEADHELKGGRISPGTAPNIIRNEQCVEGVELKDEGKLYSLWPREFAMWRWHVRGVLFWRVLLYRWLFERLPLDL